MTQSVQKYRTADVVYPIPGGGPYTYLLPDGFEGELAAGCRVVGSLGRRVLTGVVTETGTVPPAGVRLKKLSAVIDERPLVPSELLELARWIGEYYLCEPGEALRAVVPGIFLRVGDRMVRMLVDEIPLLNNFTRFQIKLLQLLEDRRERQLLESALARRLKVKSLGPGLAELAGAGIVKVTDHLPILPRERSRTMVKATENITSQEAEKLLARSPRQRECLEYLKGMNAPVELSLLSRLNFSSAVVGALAARDLVDKYEVYDPRDPFRTVDFPDYQLPQPSAGQLKVIDTILRGADSHGVHLLHGVTGSGKTLVYMELLRPLLKQGKQAIILVPEIALTPQTTGRFRAVFGGQVAVLHSGLSEGERYDIWRQIRSGHYQVAVGPRSAVFAPFDNLGLIVIDEEQEHTYKQDTTPRYHAREVAIARMRRAGGTVLLGSATPSLESFQRTRDGDYTLHELPERVKGLPLPEVSISDLRRGYAKDGSHIVGDKLLTEIGWAVESGGQVLLLLNRRGFHSFVLCEDCGEVVGCPHCRISLTVHRRLNRLVCHYCDHQSRIAQRCPACESEQLVMMGMGTEQVESLLQKHFSELTIDRMDMDTTGGKWSHHEILERLRRGETDILVGTQMIAKGLDFPNVLLVGVVNADTAMNLPDFRATERTFGLLAQVAGRTGRGEQGGEVVIQTYNPSHPAVRCAVDHDYRSFASQELALRREAGYPPFVSLLNVIISGRDEPTVKFFADRTAEQLLGYLGKRSIKEKITVLGPAPCPLEKLRGRYRYHLILKSEDSAPIGTIGSWISRNARPPSKGNCRLTLDRDPLSLM
ncbi:MAG: primosomal protein N' [Candidatus Glassbacteria bacterium]|nr:primosomal protein N' [Candidatus Glassbacteria bacterium]